MRRFTAVMLVLVMLLASVIPAFAESETEDLRDAEIYHSQGDGSQTAGVEETGVIVSHGVSAGYEVVIPSYIPLLPPKVGVAVDGDGNKYSKIEQYKVTTVNLSVANVHLPRANALSICMESVNYSDGWKIVSTTNAAQTLNYAISTSSNISESTVSIAQGASILSCRGGVASAAAEIYFAVTSLPRVGGSYNDTITFKVQVVAAS